ncbi:hypothetical protein Acsp03_15250 [Actinomadura sp. NBRC 104412]|nr:hypothetical protein Acsp03_15250 [Actinomadura sp. NBRC 104412]
MGAAEDTAGTAGTSAAMSVVARKGFTALPEEDASKTVCERTDGETDGETDRGRAITIGSRLISRSDHSTPAA